MTCDDSLALRERLRRLVIIVDFCCAGAWIFGNARHWSGQSYKPARDLLGFLPAGWELRPVGILVAAVTAGIIATGTGRRRSYYLLAFLIIFIWCFWALLFAWAAATSDSAGLLAPFMFGGWAWLHILLLRSSEHA